MRCPECGHDNPGTCRRCEQCGQELGGLAPEVTPEPGEAKRTAGGRECPKCGAPVPVFRLPTSLRQVLWGGWTCRRCGCEVDRKGRPV